MTTSQTSGGGHRDVWFRRAPTSTRYMRGVWKPLWLSDISNAAGRETLLTATPYFASIMTDLFQDMLIPHHKMKWRANGFGIGRDARIAYSSLFGRYFSRSYLQKSEGVRILVPLDAVKDQLNKYGYSIKKDPPGNGPMADWVGLDQSRLIIAEAKGAFGDRAYQPWHGPASVPRVLESAISQADRTRVLCAGRGSCLPAKRWAIASRWATEQNGREPTLLAWYSEGERLPPAVYMQLWRIFGDADVTAVLTGLRHNGAAPSLRSRRRAEGELHLEVGNRAIEPGYAAMVESTRVRALRNSDDVEFLRSVHAEGRNIAIVSLSTRHIREVLRLPESDRGENTHVGLKRDDGGGRFSESAGLTVVWPGEGEEIVMVGD